MFLLLPVLIACGSDLISCLPFSKVYSNLKRLDTIDDFDIERFGAGHGVAYEKPSVSSRA